MRHDVVVLALLALSRQCRCDCYDSLLARGIPSSTTSVFGRVLVHLHYTENPRDRCETIVKRTNLAIFIKNAVMADSTNALFVFTGSKLPNATEFFSSIGIRPWGDEILPESSSSVLVAKTDSTSTLCPRAQVLRDYAMADESITHVLFVSDAARGPFVEEGSHFLRRFEDAFSAESQTMVAGISTSCVMDFHAESYTIMVDRRAFGIFLAAYERSCDFKDKTEIMVSAEVMPVSAVLKNTNGSVAGLWPSFFGMNASIRACLLTPVSNPASACSSVYKSMRYYDQHNMDFPATPKKMSDVVFTKFYLGDRLPAAFRDAVSDLSATVLQHSGDSEGRHLEEWECHHHHHYHHPHAY